MSVAFHNWGPRFVARGVDYGDVIRLSSSIERWDDWLPRWAAVAQEHADLAAEWEEVAHRLSAGGGWNRAALCFHFARFLETRDAEAYRATSARAVEARARALSLLDPDAERLEIDLPPSRMTAILRRPAGVRLPPLILLIPGLDSTKEEFQTWEEVFLARGLATLALDGPGQGEGGYGGAPMRPDYEAAVAAVLDAIGGRAGINLGRVGLVGVSLGGYYAARAAAFEPRVRAVVSIGGAYDLADCWEALPTATREKAVFHGVGEVARFSLRGVASRIRRPLLIVFGRQDRIFPPSQAERLAAEAPAARLVMYETGNHACTNLFWRHTPMEADWLRDNLS